MIHDTISDLIIQIKNASSTKKESVLIPYSNLKFAIASKLSEKGFVKSPVKKGKKVAKFLEIGLIYNDGVARISDVERLSKPSKRIYIGASEIRPVKQGYGSLILSTPNGILSDDEARKAKVGGEILFKIW
jgi:small subunit ribosomal protein S8